MIKIILSLLLVNLCFGESHTAVHIDSLFLQSSFVGVIDIASGVMTDSNGAIYVGRVIEVIKGDSSAKEVRFGNYRGLAIGSRYLVFLNKSNSDLLTILDSFTFESTHLNQNREYIVSHPKPDEVFKIPTSRIILPNKLKSYIVDQSNVEWSKDKIMNMKWIKTEDLLNHLRNK